jgi:plasmid maintenance system antidote protein VapI
MQNDKLRGFIRSQNMTQNEFAECLGLRRETVSRFVSGSEPITSRFIGDFFLAFGPEATAVVFGSEPVPQVAVT